MQSSTSTYLVLDTNALAQTPSALSYKAAGLKVVVPPAVLSELTRSSAVSGSVLPALIAQASAAGTVVVPESSPFKVVGYPEIIRLSEADRQVLATAQAAKKADPSLRVIVASDDRHIKTIAAKLGIEFTSSSRLTAVLNELGGTQSEPIAEAVSDAREANTRRQGTSVVLGVSLGVAGTLAANNAVWLLETIPTWGTIVILPSLAILLFSLRKRRRLGYGVAEFLFGLSTAAWVALPVAVEGALTFDAAVKSVGAVYVMVRGLNNIEKGLQAMPIAGVWRRLFGA